MHEHEGAICKCAVDNWAKSQHIGKKHMWAESGRTGRSPWALGPVSAGLACWRRTRAAGLGLGGFAGGDRGLMVHARSTHAVERSFPSCSRPMQRKQGRR